MHGCYKGTLHSFTIDGLRQTGSAPNFLYDKKKKKKKKEEEEEEEEICLLPAYW